MKYVKNHVVIKRLLYKAIELFKINTYNELFKINTYNELFKISDIIIKNGRNRCMEMV